jgi:phosphotriesterase-related protein
MIRTVGGDVDDIRGAILAHEHLQIDLTHQKSAAVMLGPEDEEDIVSDLRTATAHGLEAVVDLSVPGSGRDPVALRRISKRSGVAVVCATGFYWDPFPSMVVDGSAEELRDTMIREIATGVGDTTVRCGVIKIGTGPGRISSTAERLFRAAAAASRATGAALITHTSSLDQVAWHLDMLGSCGVDFSRVLISHFGLSTVSQLIEAGAFGVLLGIDKIGAQKGRSDEQLADLVRDACAAGLETQIILSSDLARWSRLHRHGGTSYSTVFLHFVPLLLERGITKAQIDTMLRDNPRRLLELPG